MTTTNTAIYPQGIKNTVITILPATTTTLVTAYTGGSNGSRIISWIVTLTDGTTRDLQISFTISATAYLLGTVNIPLGAGNTNAVPSINMLNQTNLPGLAVDSNGNPYLYIASGTTLQINTTTTVTTAKTLTSIIQAGDY